MPKTLQGYLKQTFYKLDSYHYTPHFFFPFSLFAGCGREEQFDDIHAWINQKLLARKTSVKFYRAVEFSCSQTNSVIHFPIDDVRILSPTGNFLAFACLATFRWSIYLGIVPIIGSISLQAGECLFIDKLKNLCVFNKFFIFL